MNITITLDTEKETVEDLRQLQRAIDELIGKKLGAVPLKQEMPTHAPLQTISPKPEPQVQSAGYPVQPESQPEVNATSPYGLGEQVAEQSQQATQQQPRGWPTSTPQSEPVQQQPKKTQGGCTIDNYEDLSGKLSDIFSRTKTR